MPPHAVGLPEGGLEYGNIHEGPIYPWFSPDGTRFLLPGAEPDTLDIRQTDQPDRVVLAQSSLKYFGRPDFSPDGKSLALVRPAQWWIRGSGCGIGSTNASGESS